MLYLNRYKDCGNGVIEYTTMRHMNVGDDTARVNYMNVPWGGVRRSVYDNLVISKPTGGSSSSSTTMDLIYPMPSWGAGSVRNVDQTGGFAIFAEAIPSGRHGEPIIPPQLPADPLVVASNGCRGPDRLGRFICSVEPISHTPQPYSYKVGIVGNSPTCVIPANVNHYAWQGTSMYFYPDIDGLTLADVKACLTPGTTITFGIYDPVVKTLEENHGLSHVFGTKTYRPGTLDGFSGTGLGTRLRWGDASNNGRDFLVYTINSGAYVNAGKTYGYRQYFIMGKYLDIIERSDDWVPETLQYQYDPDDSSGRSVALYKDNTLQIFGAAIDHPINEGCYSPSSSITHVCTGSTTPKTYYKALYQIRCLSKVVITDDPYYFAPDENPKRPYICIENKTPSGNDGTLKGRAEWTLLGFFDAAECSDIASGHQYDEDFCR